jgi:hypothetical protein
VHSAPNLNIALRCSETASHGQEVLAKQTCDSVVTPFADFWRKVGERHALWYASGNAKSLIKDVLAFSQSVLAQVTQSPFSRLLPSLLLRSDKPTEQNRSRPIAVDPLKGPLIARLFELDASGNYSLKEMVHLAFELGLVSHERHDYC